jgi:hypothetical protein
MSRGLDEKQRKEFTRLYLRGYRSTRIRELMGLSRIDSISASQWMQRYRKKLGLPVRRKITMLPRERGTIEAPGTMAARYARYPEAPFRVRVVGPRDPEIGKRRRERRVQQARVRLLLLFLV